MLSTVHQLFSFSKGKVEFSYVEFSGVNVLSVKITTRNTDSFLVGDVVFISFRHMYASRQFIGFILVLTNHFFT